MKPIKILSHALFLGLAGFLAWKAWGYWLDWSVRGMYSYDYHSLFSLGVTLLAIIAVGEVGCRVSDLLYDIGDTNEEE